MTREEFFRLQEDEAHLMAHIVGAASAARKALDELKCRREQGEDAVIWLDGRTWVVGPRPI